MRPVETREARDGTKAYFVRFRHNGKQTSKTFRGPTPLQAKRRAEHFAKMLDAFGADAALRDLEKATNPTTSQTLDELAEQHFTWKQTRVRSDRSVGDYRRDYRNWIQPLFGDRDPNSITDAEVQQWVDQMNDGTLTGTTGKPLEPKSVADRHAILHGIYRWGIAPARGLVTVDPCAGTQLPKRRKKPPKGLRPAEWQALYPALRKIDSDAADLALFLLASGWRFSEAVALNAHAVEDYGDRMYVSMTQVLRRQANGTRVIVEDAKSSAGEGRRIKLDPDAADMVRRRIDAVTGDGLVFTNSGGKQWHESNFRNRIWNKAVTAANLTRKPTPHWLRHTSVAWLVMSGQASLPEIQRRIGHESIETTIGVYGRLVDDVSDDALSAFAALRGTARPELNGGTP